MSLLSFITTAAWMRAYGEQLFAFSCARNNKAFYDIHINTYIATGAVRILICKAFIYHFVFTTHIGSAGRLMVYIFIYALLVRQGNKRKIPKDTLELIENLWSDCVRAVYMYGFVEVFWVCPSAWARALLMECLAQ